MGRVKGRTVWKWQGQNGINPQPYEIRRGYELGKPTPNRKKEMLSYIWYPCSKCGKYRWLQYSKLRRSPFRPNAKCCSCAIKENNAKTNLTHVEKVGTTFIDDGYIKIKISKDSPYICMACGYGYVPQHRLVMAEYLGRPLLNSEVVHHKDGNRANNTIDNLELLTRKEHSSGHIKGYRDGFGKGYIDGYKKGNKVAQNKKIEEILKEVRLLRWVLMQSLNKVEV